ncbi:MAG: hypothetical protein AVDCRST_MAG06-3372, partial [uncultured Nocardioides sp.]
DRAAGVPRRRDPRGQAGGRRRPGRARCHLQRPRGRHAGGRGGRPAAAAGRGGSARRPLSGVGRPRRGRHQRRRPRGRRARRATAGRL